MQDMVFDALNWISLAAGAIWVLYQFVATRKQRLARQQEIIDTIQVVGALRDAGRTVPAAYAQCHLTRRLQAAYPPYHLRFGIRPRLTQNILPLLAWLVVIFYGYTIVRWVDQADALYASYERGHRDARFKTFAARIDKLKSQAGAYARDTEIWKDERGLALAREVDDHLWDIGTGLISWSTANEPGIESVIVAKADAVASAAGRLASRRKPILVTRIAMATAGEPEPGSPKAEFIRFRGFLSDLRMLPAIWTTLYRNAPETRTVFMWRPAWVKIGTALAFCVWLYFAISGLWWREAIARDELAAAAAGLALSEDEARAGDAPPPSETGTHPPATDST